MSEPLPAYGGQAVIEGVMMRGRRACAVAVRRPDGEIQIERFDLSPIYQSRLATFPLLRGVILLWDALGLGMRALTYSANVQAGEDEKIEGASLWLTMATSFAAGVALFFVLPALLALGAERWLAWGTWTANLVEGLVRLGLLLGYMWLIGRLPEVERVFGYHGAEHQTIHAFEAGAELTPERVLQFPREHPRCGTAFLLTVVVLSVLVFALLGPLDWLPRLASRIVLIPALAAVAFEYLRLTSRFRDRWWGRWLLAPNLLVQRLTTRQPEAPMAEVAIAAFQAMRHWEREDLPQPEAEALAA
ncbi:MAG TPA: DUF1385 domain-containing protein [Anaerolineales bacterium]